MSEFSTPIDMLQSPNEPSIDSSPIDQMPSGPPPMQQQPMQQMQPMQMQYNPNIPMEPMEVPKLEEPKTKSEPVNAIFNKRAQYELMYIIIAGIILNSDMVQKMLIRNIPMLFNAEGHNTLFGTVFQTAVLGVVFLVLRHFTSVQS